MKRYKKEEITTNGTIFYNRCCFTVLNMLFQMESFEPWRLNWPCLHHAMPPWQSEKCLRQTHQLPIRLLLMSLEADNLTWFYICLVVHVVGNGCYQNTVHLGMPGYSDKNCTDHLIDYIIFYIMYMWAKLFFMSILDIQFNALARLKSWE